MNSTFTRWALVLGLCALPLAAHSQDGPGKKRPQTINRMVHRLKLSEEQKVRIEAIQTRHAEGSKVQRQELAEARKTFRSARQNPDTPEAQLKSLHQSLSDLEFKSMLQRRAMLLEIQAVLTPEQRTQWTQIQHRGKRRGSS